MAWRRRPPAIWCKSGVTLNGKSAKKQPTGLNRLFDPNLFTWEAFPTRATGGLI